MEGVVVLFWWYFHGDGGVDVSFEVEVVEEVDGGLCVVLYFL